MAAPKQASKKATVKTVKETAKTPTRRTVVAQKVRGRAQQETSGFLDFIRGQGVIGLAIGLVIGTQVKGLVDQLIRSFIDPLLGLVVGSGGGLSSKVFNLSLNGKNAVFGWGAFVYTLIDFLIIAAVVYFTVKWLKLDKLDKKKD